MAFGRAAQVKPQPQGDRLAASSGTALPKGTVTVLLAGAKLQSWPSRPGGLKPIGTLQLPSLLVRTIGSWVSGSQTTQENGRAAAIQPGVK